MTEEQAKEMFERVPDHIKDFIRLVEGFYSEYANDIVRCFIALDMQDFTPDQLRELFDLIRRDYSNTYKTPPDTNRLIKAWEKKYEQSGLKNYGKYFEDKNRYVFDACMNKIGHYDGDRFIPMLRDEKLRQKVIDMGAVKMTPIMLMDLRDE